jgi:F-type H+-transporting ATPase subunit gamma
MHREPVLLTEGGEEGRIRKACYIVVTSDKGLAGALNSAVIKLTESHMQKRGDTKENSSVYAVGRRGGEYFASRGYTMLGKRENVADSVAEGELREITNALFEAQQRGDFNSCFVVYTNFISTFEQQAVVRQILPLISEMLGEIVHGILPAKGKYAGIAKDEQERPSVYTIEPEADVVLAELLPKLLNIAVFHALLEAKASEHSARMVAMKSATDKAKEMAHDLTRTFNKVRQAAITREVSEITSGIEAMR